MKKKNWDNFQSAQPLSLFHGEAPSKEDLELGMRLVCAGKLVPNKDSVSIPSRAANEVAQCYAEKHAKYYSHRHKNWRKVVDSNRGVVGCCSRAAAQADLLNASIADYLEAQFWFFDEAFSRPPTYAEIAAPKCLLRYNKWRVAVVHEGVPTTTVSKSRGRVDPSKTKESVVQAYEEKVLERMIKQWGSEEKVWELFGEPGDEEVFSDKFKKTRVIWREQYEGE